jgi:hypothetical protein
MTNHVVRYMDNSHYTFRGSKVVCIHYTLSNSSLIVYPQVSTNLYSFSGSSNFLSLLGAKGSPPSRSYSVGNQHSLQGLG